jgi:hypothetical protein
MKRLLFLTAIFMLILAIASPAIAQEGAPAPNWADAETRIFLPTILQDNNPFNLSGQIKDAQDVPLSGATVVTDGGQVGITDINGVYQMATHAGDLQLAASKEGYDFKPGTADLTVNADMHDLNFTAVSKSEGSLLACTNLLINPNFEGVDGWTISPANNPSSYTQQFWWSPVWSMLSGWPLGTTNTFPNQYTTSEFWQAVTIPANATIARLQMYLLPRSADPWGYHITEQAAMDASFQLNAPDATESQYAHIRDGANTTTLYQFFKWFPISSRWWLYRSYDLTHLRQDATHHLDLRGQTIGVLFGATDWGDGWNTALYVDDVYLYYCTP